MEIYCDASEGKLSSESIVKFPGVKNFTVGSISLSAMKILRWAWATLRLEAAVDGCISSVTGVVILLLILTTVLWYQLFFVL